MTLLYFLGIFELNMFRDSCVSFFWRTPLCGS